LPAVRELKDVQFRLFKHFENRLDLWAEVKRGSLIFGEPE
jgi:hypothetical protein